MPKELLTIFRFNYRFVDTSTGEIIKELSEEANTYHLSSDVVSNFVDNSKIPTIVASFMRGCKEKSSLSLTINFEKVAVF